MEGGHLMYYLDAFTLEDMEHCSEQLRELGLAASSLESAAGRITRYLYEHLLIAGSGERACRLVRLFKTHTYDELDEELKGEVREPIERSHRENQSNVSSRFLTLMGTAGDEEDWNDRRKSKNHKIIPLSLPTFAHDYPMIAHLFLQFGLDLTPVAKPDELVITGEHLAIQSPDIFLADSHSSFQVFWVPQACGSPLINAQAEFVTPYSIKSVIGFGGMLSNAAMFAMILFSRVEINHEVAQMFKPLALSSKNALLQVGKLSDFEQSRGPLLRA